MKIIYRIGRFKKKLKTPIVAIGVFDGLHHGHRKLIRKLVERAHAKDGTAIVVTFWPHPLQILKPRKHLKLIASLPYRLKLLDQANIDVCMVIPFTKRFSSLSPEKFVQRYLVERLHVCEVVVGDDFRFGRHRKGNTRFLQKLGKTYGFAVHEIKTKQGGRKLVSSSRIRQLIAKGKILQASKFLDRPVSILGRVVYGDARGKQLGYPTANISSYGRGTPPLGVYAVGIKIGRKKYRGVANVGRRPSFKKDDNILIEVHIFHFDKNLYGKEVVVEFLKKIRDERRFYSSQALVKQIRVDVKKAHHWFAHHK